MPADVGIVNLDESLKDFADTAAVIQNLDVFIGVDSALIHLAGALNKKSLLMLSYSVDGRWFVNCPQPSNLWYNSVTIFRQKNAGEWSDVVRDALDHVAKYK